MTRFASPVEVRQHTAIFLTSPGPDLHPSRRLRIVPPGSRALGAVSIDCSRPVSRRIRLPARRRVPPYASWGSQRLVGHLPVCSVWPSFPVAEMGAARSGEHTHIDPALVWATARARVAFAQCMHLGSVRLRFVVGDRAIRSGCPAADLTLTAVRAWTQPRFVARIGRRRTTCVASQLPKT